ncbi:MAG: GNAT family N-acetyltransferase [Bacteroidales bacterium]|nr:GNAT family N-acetyltransferase [Bacteroidales bacterium]HPD94919.1 GNAT family N-acetyltransferase [Tenuifilaceae bacterium]HRX31342.1 GNAT family N-acetyltransferase [Tenuifilaceae bacterium]
MISTAKLTLKQLTVFSNDTKLFNRELLPISRTRALSYMANPRANNDDNVLYLAYDDDRLVGYRSVLPDLAYIDEKPHRFVWLSGTWVHPDYRRRGISTRLLEDITADWNGMVLGNRMAPGVKQIFDKITFLHDVFQVDGIRFHLRKTFLKTYNCCNYSNRLGRIGERCINFFNFSILNRNLLKLPTEVELDYFSRPDAELNELFAQSCEHTLTKRTDLEWNWILRFPWLLSAPLPDVVSQKYFFASAVKSFNQFLVKVYRGGELLGMLHMQHSNTRFSVPFSNFNEEYADLMAKIVLLHAHKCKASFITVYNPLLINGLKQLRMYYFYSTDRVRKYVATNPFAQMLNGKVINFADGEGDNAFI